MSLPQALVVERWTSDDEREEVHLFIPGERNAYILGFNPDIVDDQLVSDLLAKLGYQMPA